MAYDNLTEEEVRVIGCLLEKEVTTPDHYPLSINALTNACNQKSNRDPVVHYSEQQVQQIVHQLESKHLVASTSGFGSRVTKYKHRFCNTELGDFRLSDQEKALVCVLFLRGAQTPGELRGRTQRLCDFSSVQAVEQTLMAMASRAKPLVVQCERQAGKRESRWLHLLGTTSESINRHVSNHGSSQNSQNVNAVKDDQTTHDSQQTHGSQQTHDSQQSQDTQQTNARIEQLEERVEQLEQQIQQLSEQINNR